MKEKRQKIKQIYSISVCLPLNKYMLNTKTQHTKGLDQEEIV